LLVIGWTRVNNSEVRMEDDVEHVTHRGSLHGKNYDAEIEMGPNGYAFSGFTEEGYSKRTIKSSPTRATRDEAIRDAYEYATKVITP
jgi:hypothetical protein